jgi:lysophospholipase L1-like esterase
MIKFGYIFLLLAFALPQKKITVWLIGDSTMANKEVKAWPETGWGMPFSYFFDSSVVVDNRAKNGRSTRTFISEGLWSSVVDHIQPGDYVFMEFGHNDESKEKVDRYTSPEDYRANLVRFITETRAKKGNPVLLTPVTRRRFDSTGTVMHTHGVYPQIVRDLAAEYRGPLIVMDEKTRDLLQQFGRENSKWLFMQLEKGEHPNYPDGRNDNTHFNELGARKVAEIVLASIRELKLPLADHIRVPEIKK